MYKALNAMVTTRNKTQHNTKRFKYRCNERANLVETVFHGRASRALLMLILRSTACLLDVVVVNRSISLLGENKVRRQSDRDFILGRLKDLQRVGHTIRGLREIRGRRQSGSRIFYSFRDRVLVFISRLSCRPLSIPLNLSIRILLSNL